MDKTATSLRALVGLKNNALDIMEMSLEEKKEPAEVVDNLRHLGHRSDVRTLCFTSDNAGEFRSDDPITEKNFNPTSKFFEVVQKPTASLKQVLNIYRYHFGFGGAAEALELSIAAVHSLARL